MTEITIQCPACGCDVLTDDDDGINQYICPRCTTEFRMVGEEKKEGIF